MVAYTVIQKFPGCGRNDSWQNLARVAVILFLVFCALIQGTTLKWTREKLWAR